MTLDTVRALAERYVPVASRWDLFDDEPAWGPAHEMGHLLVAQPWQIGVANFCLGDGSETRPSRWSQVEEVAASIVQTWVLVACAEWPNVRLPYAGRGTLVQELRSSWHHGPEFLKEADLRRDARALIAARGLTRRQCQSETGLEMLCQRALRAAA